MDDLMAIMLGMWIVPLALVGIWNIVSAIYAVKKTRDGFVHALLLLAGGGRGKFYWAKPEDKAIKVAGKSYNYTDHPNYMTLVSSMFGATPTIVLDEKTAEQRQLSGTPTDKDAINPQQLDGVVNFAYKRGYQDGIEGVINFKLYFILLAALVALCAVAQHVMK